MPEPATAPIDPVNSRLASDGGPVYVETEPAIRIDPDGRLLIPPGAGVVEPWNAASATLFLVIVLVWLVRLRGRFLRYPFLTCCLPILAAGGIGGVMYHAYRTSNFYLKLDYIPISLLGLSASLYLWVRLPLRWVHVMLLLTVFVAVQAVAALSLPTQAFISVNYAAMALFILTPTVLVLVRTGGAHAGWVLAAAGVFGVALFFRVADTWRPPLLPMGTHWLWHTFGAAATVALSEYVYKLEGMPSFRHHDGESEGR
jgi:hypothetical protein